MITYFKDLLANLGVQGFIAQGIGILAALCELLSYQQKKQRGIMLFQASASALWILHMAMLGGLSAAIMNIIGLVRSLLFSFREKHAFARLKIWQPTFIVLIVAGSVIAWFNGEGWRALFPCAAMILSIFAYSRSNAFHVRLLSLTLPPFWMTYNILCGSVAGIITEICNFTSTIVGIFRIDIPERKKSKSEKITNEKH